MNEVITTLISLLSIAFLVVLLFWFYKDYRTDVLRQKMFKLRDSLFDEASCGKIDFNDDSYVMIRSAINGFIRFGHRLSLAEVLLLSMALKKENYTDKLFSVRLQENLTDCSTEHQQIIMDHYRQMNLYIIEHMILPYIPLLIPILLLWLAKAHIGRVVDYFRVPLDTLDAAALATGKM